MSKIVNGSSLQPLSGAAPRQLVLLLHGYGSNGADLISLAPHWRQACFWRPMRRNAAARAPATSGGRCRPSRRRRWQAAPLQQRLPSMRSSTVSSHNLG